MTADAEATPVAVLEQAAEWAERVAALPVRIVAADAAEVLFGAPDRLADALRAGCRPAWCQSSWAGVRPLVEPARAADVPVAGVKGVFGPLVSEYVFAWLLRESRAAARYEQAQRVRQWSTEPPGRLRGQTLAVIGTGSIGAHVAGTARRFGMRTIGVSRSGAAVADFDAVHPTGDLGDAVADADTIVACLPDTPDTATLMDRAFFARVQRGAAFVNVGRAATVDHAALVAALDAGILRRALLDVLPVEPLPADDPLWDVPRLAITPHVAAVSDPGDIVALFAENLDRYRRGAALAHLVDLARGY